MKFYNKLWLPNLRTKLQAFCRSFYHENCMKIAKAIFCTVKFCDRLFLFKKNFCCQSGSHASKTATNLFRLSLNQFKHFSVDSIYEIV